MTHQRNIETKIIADSVNPNGDRITTSLWTYPRFIHAEIMTHRAFSRNAASSRAIPAKKVLQAVDENPALPEFWGSNKAGMQAGAELEGEELLDAIETWRSARFGAMEVANKLAGLGLHKQIANRVLEPWFRITVLVTATDWANFFALRAHPAAQPEFQVLAYRHLNDMMQSTPTEVDWYDWHIPFRNDAMGLSYQLKASVASCARTSYVAYDSDKSLEEQVALHDALASSGHWSPFEHQAQAAPNVTRSGNFTGSWEQYRQQLPVSVHRTADYAELMAAKPEWIML